MLAQVAPSHPIVKSDITRWNARLSKAFDVTSEQFPPRSAEEALVSKYLGVAIKDLERRVRPIPSVRLGAYLTAAREVLAKWSTDDIRNLNYEGMETPPLYEVIQLNSTTSADFLVDGMRFLRLGDPKAGVRATLRVQPRWYGVDLTTYGLRTLGTAEQLLAEIGARAKEINFLKGEAFALSGEFLPKTDESFADLFLDQANAVAVARVVRLINERGKALENRGVLLMGPPGTGKTLAARIVRNEAKATFIWVSARDFHYAGSFGGFTEAFDLARECAPSVVVFEDVDNWLTERTVDLLKTEMDGVARSTGVVTMMTTNFPELLPAALIDRPGRFHDVLKFDLPNPAARQQMLERWLPGLTKADMARAVAATEGYSGAHVRELTRFAKIIAEEEQLPLDKALTAALVKLAEQRALITATQMSGSRYRMAPALQKSALPDLTIQRAFATLQVKSVDQQTGRRFSGVATSPRPDRVDDVIEPLGAQFAPDLPLLLFHHGDKPVGTVMFRRPTKDGIPFEAVIPEVAEPGIVKDLTDQAAHLVKYGLIKSVSIGFRQIADAVERLASGGIRFLKSEILELSLVSVPMNPDAAIHTVKSLDIGRPAATGTEAIDAHRHTPRDRGTSGVVVKATRKDPPMKTIPEQIKDFENTRAAKSARMSEIMSKAADTGETLDDAQSQEYDGLESEVKSVDAHLVRLRKHEEMNKAAAVPVAGANPVEATIARGGQPIRVSEPVLEKGIAFARYVSCKAASAVHLRNGDFFSPLDIAKQRYPSNATLLAVFEKAAVPAGTTYGSHWADDLVPYKVLASDFIEFLRGKTIVDRFGQDGIPSLRKVPFNTRVGGFSAGTTGYWKGEGKPTPMSRATSMNVTLTWSTVSGLTVITKELATHSTPSAETALRNDLAAAVIARMDIDFVDPAKAAVANTSPASITYGLAANAPSGTAAVNIRRDIASLLSQFATAKLGRSNLVLIMSDTMAGNISMMVNALGQADFPTMDLSAAVPRLAGIPIITSEHLTSLGSPSTQLIVLVKADEVYLADDGMVDVEASFEASIEMLDSSLQQDGITGTGASLVNLWQSGLIGLLANREVNWQLRRANAVEYISPAAYTPPSS